MNQQSAPPPTGPFGLDLGVVASGAGVAMAIGAVTTIAVLLADLPDGSRLSLLGSFGALAGFFLGGARSGRHAPDRPLMYGAAAAFSAFAMLQLLGVARRLTSGDDLSWIAYPFRSLLAATTGMLGAMLGVALLNRNERMAARDNRPHRGDPSA